MAGGGFGCRPFSLVLDDFYRFCSEMGIHMADV
jgi:hypothetical protein